MKFVSDKKDLSMKKFFRRYLIIPLLSLAFLFAIVTHAVAKNTSVPLACKSESATFKNATIEFINAERTSLSIEQCNLDQSKPALVNFSVDSPELKGILEGFSSGDLVNLSYANNNILKSISVVVSKVNETTLWGTIIGTFIVLILLTWAILGLVKWNALTIRELFVGKDKRLSNSKSQMAVWFFVLIASYVSLTWLRANRGGLGFVGGIGIPQNLLLLSGVSALTYAGAKVITQSQVNSKPGSKPDAEDGQASPADFVTDDLGNTDFGDFQMTVITILAVGVYLVQIFNFLGVLKLYKSVTLPDVDTTILSIFGLSQGAYLTKKAVAATGAQEPQLKLDTKGEKVKNLKKLLNQKLVGSGLIKSLDEADDNFDKSTEDAVKIFQKQNNLAETGIVESKTREKLLGL
jgi:Putative peptidoglycan binding domain